jgi:hypothetical protein
MSLALLFLFSSMYRMMTLWWLPLILGDTIVMPRLLPWRVDFDLYLGGDLSEGRIAGLCSSSFVRRR